MNDTQTDLVTGHDMNKVVTGVPVIVMAAGQARRFGAIKQLAKLGGQTLLDSAVEKAQVISNQVLVVTGAYREHILSALSRFAKAGVYDCYCPDWEEGMGTVLATAVRETLRLWPQSNGILVMLVDQPLVSADHLKTLIDAGQTSSSNVASSWGGNNMGVPAYFQKASFDALINLRGEQGGKRILVENDLIRVSCEYSQFDIDTPEDLQVVIDMINLQSGLSS